MNGLCLAALVGLGKHIGFYEADNQQRANQLNQLVISPEQRQAWLDDQQARLKRIEAGGDALVQ